MLKTKGFKLRDYQQEILDNLKDSKSIGLFMGTGSGKTLTSLQRVADNKSSFLLVVCPPTIIGQWEEKITQHLEGSSLPDFKKSWNSERRIEYLTENEGNWNSLVISFNVLDRFEDYLSKTMGKDWTFIIDESHRIKEIGSLWSPKVATTSALLLRKKTDHKIILTATPTEKKHGGYVDLYSQLLFLDVFKPIQKFGEKKTEFSLIHQGYEDFKKHFAVTKSFDVDNPRYKKQSVLLEAGIINEAVFKQRTSKLKEKFTVENIVGYKNVPVLDARVKKACRYYESKNGDFEPLFELVYFDKTKSYDKTEREKKYKDIDLTSSEMRERISLLTLTTGRITGTKLGDDKIITYDDNKNKLNWIEDFLTDNDEIPIIFYNWNVQFEQLKELMNKMGKTFIVLNGSTKDKLAEIRRDDYEVILAQFQSAAESIDELQFKSHIEIFYSLPLSSLTYIQALGRIDRVGQTKVPMYYFLVTKDTKEDDIYYGMKNKIEYRETTLNNLKLDRLKKTQKNKQLI